MDYRVGVGQWSQVHEFDWTGGPDEGNWQRAIIVDFVKKIVPLLDQINYVERYAWFPFDGFDTTKYGNGAGGLFFCGADDPLKGLLTSVGKANSEVGNPVGWDSDNPTDDMVVMDDSETEDHGKEPSETPVIEVTGVTLNKTKLTIEEEISERLMAVVLPENTSDKEVRWTSSDKNVATVDESGVVMGVKAGTATITAETGSGSSVKKASCVVTVTEKPAGAVAVTGVKLDSDVMKLMKGETKQLTETVRPMNADNKK